MKRGFIVGCITGAALGVAVALGMDSLMGGGAGTGWSDAVARDLGSMTGRLHARDSLAVKAGVAAVVGLLGAVGALVGGVAGAVVGRFVSSLDKGA